MTQKFIDFELQVLEAYNRPLNKDKNKGRVAYAELRLARPDLAGQISGTSLDPFNDDKKLDEFWQFVENNWNA